MKVVALIALAFALANSATTDVLRPWGSRGMFIREAMQTPWYISNSKTQYDNNNLFFGQKINLPETRQLNSYQDKGMTVSQQAMKRLLFETEQLLQQQRYDSLDTDLAERLVSHLCERMLQRLEEIEETLLQEAIQQVSEDQPNLLMAYGSEIVQRMVKEQAATVLREVVEKTENESVKLSLETILAVQMLNQHLQQKESISVTSFMNEVEQVLEQTIIDDIERAIAESSRRLKHIQRKIQLSNQQLQKVKLHETTNRQQTEMMNIIEKVKQQVLQNLNELKINEMAYRMATISLQKMLITQQYRMQQVSFQQAGNMDDMMMDKHFTMPIIMQ